MFQQPHQGDQVKVAELLGCLVLVYARELREDVATTYGPSDAIVVDIHVLDGGKGGEKFENTMLFQKALIGSLRSAIGGEPVLGRVGQGVNKPGQSAPYILQPFTDADAALATGYIQRMQGQGFSSRLLPQLQRRRTLRQPRHRHRLLPRLPSPLTSAPSPRRCRNC